MASAKERFSSKLEENTYRPEDKVHTGQGHCACQEPFYNTRPVIDWMMAVPEHNGSTDKNVNLLLKEVKAGTEQKGLLIEPYNSESYSMIVFIILLHLNRGHLIYIFQDAKIIDANLELDFSVYPEFRKKIRRYGGDADQIIRDFERAKWRFFPASFEDIKIGKVKKEHRLPFCFLRQVNNEGATARVFEVTVPEAFIKDELKERFRNYVVTHKHGQCYRLAIKAYAHYQFELFRSERQVFQGLVDRPYMVRYFGSYDHYDGQSYKEVTHNIILEYGESDLSGYFKRMYPPVKSFEIFAFWKSIFNVASAIRTVHQLSHNGDNYDGCHGDISPGNILCVRPDFKLSDFGFSKFELVVKENKSPPETLSKEQGASTYGPPIAGNGSMINSQKSDIWSFGCVLSIAATWIVLGLKGIAQYENTRAEALMKLKLEAEDLEDRFHDKQRVLPEIENWHNHLRTVTRMSDHFTTDLLNLIDNHMLVPEWKRISSKDLCKKLEELCETWTILGVDSELVESQLNHDKRLRDVNSTPSPPPSPVKYQPNKPILRVPSPATVSLRSKSREESARNSISSKEDLMGSLSSLQSKRIEESARDSISSKEGFVGSLSSLRSKRREENSRNNIPSREELLGSVHEATVNRASSATKNTLEEGRGSTNLRRGFSRLHVQSPSPRSSSREAPQIKEASLITKKITKEEGEATGSRGSISLPRVQPPNPRTSNHETPRVPFLLPTDAIFDGDSIWDIINDEGAFPMNTTRSFNAIMSVDEGVGERTNNEGRTPIMMAALRKNMVLVELLLEHSDLQRKDKIEGKTLLHHMVDGSHGNETAEFLATMNKIIEKSADKKFLVNILNDDKESPLFHCVHLSMPKTAELLIKNGSSIHPSKDFRGKDVLIEAVRSSKIAIVKLCLKGDNDGFHWDDVKNHTDISKSTIPTDIKDLLKKELRQNTNNSSRKQRLWSKW